MQRRRAGALLVLAAALGAPALDARAEEPVIEKADSAEQESAENRFEKLEKAVRAAQQKVYADYRAAAEKEQAAAKAEGRDAVMPAFDMGAAIKPHVAEFEGAAKEYAGTDDAVRFLTWLVINAGTEQAGQSAYDALATTHIESSEIGKFVMYQSYLARQFGEEKTRATLDTAIEKSPDADVRATALIARGEMTKANDLAAARADYEQAAEIAKDKKVAGRANGILTEMDKLQIGMVAPDIEGNDLDGVAFKLSDYRGKVVVLDFWGDW